MGDTCDVNPAGLLDGGTAGRRPHPVWTGLISRDEVVALRAIADTARAYLATPDVEMADEAYQLLADALDALNAAMAES